MKKIVLDIQSDIHAHTMERMLMQKLDDCQVVISESPDATAEWCKTHRPDVLLMEVKAYSPWMFKERMAIRDKESSVRTLEQRNRQGHRYTVVINAVGNRKIRHIRRNSVRSVVTCSMMEILPTKNT